MDLSTRSSALTPRWFVLSLPFCWHPLSHWVKKRLWIHFRVISTHKFSIKDRLSSSSRSEYCIGSRGSCHICKYLPVFPTRRPLTWRMVLDMCIKRESVAFSLLIEWDPLAPKLYQKTEARTLLCQRKWYKTWDECGECGRNLLEIKVQIIFFKFTNHYDIVSKNYTNCEIDFFYGFIYCIYGFLNMYSNIEIMFWQAKKYQWWDCIFDLTEIPLCLLFWGVVF